MPKPREVRIRISESGHCRWIKPHFGEFVDGTDELLAVTQRYYWSDWEVTHCRTGCAFGFRFPTHKEALQAAKSLYSHFPRSRLLARKDAVAGGRYRRETIRRWMGLEAAK